MPKAQVCQRRDGKWAWHLLADNGYVLASDGGQGYNNAADAENMCRRVIRGEYASAAPIEGLG